MGSTDTTVAVVPIRSFSGGKNRLSSALNAEQRERVTRWTANRVIDSLAGHDVLVVTGEESVSSWAADRGCATVDPENIGLIAAAEAARHHLRSLGVARMAVIHADLPCPGGLPELIMAKGSIIVPDLRGDGTNVLAIPVDSTLTFSYGRGSFRRHLAGMAADHHVRSISVLHDPLLGLDIDTVEDLHHPVIAPLIEEVIA